MPDSWDDSCSTLKDQVRALIGDTEAPFILTDVFIESQLSAYPWPDGPWMVANAALQKLSKEPTKFAQGQAGFQGDFTDRVKSLQQLMKDLKAGKIPEPGVSGVLPSASTQVQAEAAW
jgi:hypothetical protein